MLTADHSLLSKTKQQAKRHKTTTNYEKQTNQENKNKQAVIIKSSHFFTAIRIAVDTYFFDCNNISGGYIFFASIIAVDIFLIATITVVDIFFDCNNNNDGYIFVASIIAVDIFF